MGMSLNHTINRCRDQQRSATFVASPLGQGHLLEIITRPSGSGD